MSSPALSHPAPDVCPDVSICIVTLNCREYLRDCLRSIFQSAPESLEVVIADNGSTDGTLEMLEQDFAHCPVVRNGSNIGFGRAGNRAMRNSRGRFLLWLNADTIVRPGAIAALIGFLERNPDVGIAGPRVLNSDGTLQPQCRRGAPTPWNSLCYFLGLRSRARAERYLIDAPRDETLDVDAVSGACLLARRDVLEQIGEIDERFFLYGEDLDWCLRARQAGWRICYVPDAEVVHFGGQASRKHPKRSVYEFHRAMWVYYRKHLAAGYNAVFSGMVLAGIAGLCVASLLRNAFRTRPIVGSPKYGSRNTVHVNRVHQTGITE